MTGFVLVVVVLVLLVLLGGLLRGVDYPALRRRPEGLLSPGGLWAVVGGGFVAGFLYGLLLGLRDDGGAQASLGRGLVDGLVVACAGAFYVAFVQRRRREGPGDRDEGGGGDGKDGDEDGDERDGRGGRP